MEQDSDTQARTGDLTTNVLDLRELFRLLRLRWYWLVGSVAFFAMGMGLAAMFLRPVYRATAVLMPVENAGMGGGALASMLGQIGGLASLAGVSLGTGGAEIEASLAVLKSRAFTERFIEEHDLLPVLYADRWDASSMRWKGEQDRWPTLSEAARYVDRELRVVSFDRRTGLVTMQMDWTDPSLPAEWVNGMVGQLNEEMRQRARQQAAAALSHLQNELKSTQVLETRAAVSRLIEAQVNQVMIANVSTEYALRVIDRAMAADKRDPVRPRRVLMVAVGTAVGSLLAMLAIVLVPARR